MFYNSEMQTPSHLLITAVLTQKGRNPTALPVSVSALLAASILPDIPFALLTLIYTIYYRWFASVPVGSSVMEYLHFELFYTDPIWLIGHNFFHSLVINTIIIGVGYWSFGRGWRWGRFLFWLGVGLLFHTIVDIFTHNSDGPLLFFPLSWTTRFASPISYWEKAYHGRIFMLLENALDIIILVYFAGIWWRQRLSTKR